MWAARLEGTFSRRFTQELALPGTASSCRWSLGECGNHEHDQTHTAIRCSLSQVCPSYIRDHLVNQCNIQCCFTTNLKIISQEAAPGGITTPQTPKKQTMIEASIETPHSKTFVQHLLKDRKLNSKTTEVCSLRIPGRRQYYLDLFSLALHNSPITLTIGMEN